MLDEVPDDTLVQPLIPPACPDCARRKRQRHRLLQWLSVVTTTLVVIGGLGAYYEVRTLNNYVPPPVHGYYNWHGHEPVGITLSALQDFVINDHVLGTLKLQTQASKEFWGANTVRYQVLQDRMVGPSGRLYRPLYMHDLRIIVRYALRLHLNVVINAQTEASVGYGRDESMPTHATYAFWQQILERNPKWQSNPHVILDLFNEPRNCTWGEWYDTHQGLVSDIRARGWHNPIWVEGRWWGSTLEGVPMLTQPKHNPPIVYTYHHPGAPKPDQAPVDVPTWDRAFGDLAKSGVPVIDGEFTNYIGSYYWGQPSTTVLPRTTVKAYLAYETEHHIAMLAWSLVPGALNSNLSFRSMSREPQGAGYLIHEWFRKTRGWSYNVKALKT